MRSGRIVALAAVVLAAAPAQALACPSCFGAADGPMASGLNAGIAVLLAVTGTVLAGFAAGIVAFIRRGRVAQAEIRPAAAPPRALVEEHG